MLRRRRGVSFAVVSGAAVGELQVDGPPRGLAGRPPATRVRLTREA